MKLNYSHVIWDWNGTLIDDTQLCVDLVNLQLDYFSLPKVDINYYRNNFRFPVRSYYSLLGLPCDEIHYQKISTVFIENYRKKFRQCLLHDGVENCLKNLHDFGVQNSILSAGMKSDLYSFVSHFLPLEIFNHISGVDNVLAQGKIEIAARHLEILQIDVSKVLMVGDTLHDLEVAIEMGVDCLLFSGGHNSCTILSESTVPVIDEISDVLEYVHD